MVELKLELKVELNERGNCAPPSLGAKESDTKRVLVFATQSQRLCLGRPGLGELEILEEQFLLWGDRILLRPGASDARLLEEGICRGAVRFTFLEWRHPRRGGLHAKHVRGVELPGKPRVL